MPWISYEWRGYPFVRHANLSLYVGLICGAFFWGCSADVVGYVPCDCHTIAKQDKPADITHSRRFAWNCTLFIGGVFGIAAGAAPNFVAFCSFIALIGFGVGGNLPVDGTMFLEFMPGAQQWLLTLLSLWWAVGQVVASLISWAFIAKYSKDCVGTPTPGQDGVPWCNKSNNSGWRYTYYCLGSLMLFLWVARIFLLPVYESPKFLSSIGKDAEAVEVVHKVAKRNGTTSDLTVEDLHAAAAPYMTDADRANESKYDTKFSVWQLIVHSFDDMRGDKLKTLFGTKRLAYSTGLIIFCYGAVGLAYPLFNQFLGSYLAAKVAQYGNSSVNETFSSYTYQAVCGVPGSMAAAYLVTWSRAGRKYSMAFFTAASGIFLFGLTACRTLPAINAMTCMAAFFENAFYGVLFGYAPELFPTPVRGTGDALCASFNRLTGLFAPIIAMYSKAALTPDGPVFASAGIFVATGFIMCFLPVETYGKTAH